MIPEIQGEGGYLISHKKCYLRLSALLLFWRLRHPRARNARA